MRAGSFTVHRNSCERSLMLRLHRGDARLSDRSNLNSCKCMFWASVFTTHPVTCWYARFLSIFGLYVQKALQLSACQKLNKLNFDQSETSGVLVNLLFQNTGSWRRHHHVPGRKYMTLSFSFIRWELGKKKKQQDLRGLHDFNIFHQATLLCKTTWH